MKPDPQLPHVFVQVPKVGPWTGSQQLGQDLDFSPNVATNRQRVIFMPENGPPRRWTVTLGVDWDSLPQLADPQDYVIQAEVQFGVGGTSDIATIDWLNGTTISVTANSITVVAHWSSGNPPIAPNKLPKLRVQLAEYPSAGITPAVLTVPFSAAAASDSAAFTVPKYARSVYLEPADQNQSNVFNALSYLQFHNGAIFTAQLKTPAFIPAGSYQGVFHNADAVATKGNLIFTIEP